MVTRNSFTTNSGLNTKINVDYDLYILVIANSCSRVSKLAIVEWIIFYSLYSLGLSLDSFVDPYTL